MKRKDIQIAYCHSCHKCAKPYTSKIASALPITKCALCNSLNIREAKKEEALSIVPVPVKVEGLKLFGI